jgi:Tfp pilus assembly protein PilN
MKRKQRRKLIWMVAGLAVLLYLGLAVFPQSLFPENDIKWKKSGRVYRAESDG